MIFAKLVKKIAKIYSKIGRHNVMVKGEVRWEMLKRRGISV